jgi:hypothetical protein
MKDRTPHLDDIQDQALADLNWPGVDLFWMSPPVAPQWSAARRTAAPRVADELAGAVFARAYAGMSHGYWTAPLPVLGIELPDPRRSDAHRIPDTFKAPR